VEASMIHGVVAGAGEAGAGCDCRAAGEGGAGGAPVAPCAAAGGAGDAQVGGICAAGVAIGPAGAGFFCASSATVSSIARSIGIRATPLFLSTHA